MGDRPINPQGGTSCGGAGGVGGYGENESGGQGGIGGAGGHGGFGGGGGGGGSGGGGGDTYGVSGDGGRGGNGGHGSFGGGGGAGGVGGVPGESEEGDLVVTDNLLKGGGAGGQGIGGVGGAGGFGGFGGGGGGGGAATLPGGANGESATGGFGGGIGGSGMAGSSGGGGAGLGGALFIRSGNVVLMNSSFVTNGALGGEGGGGDSTDGLGKGGAIFALHDLAANQNGNNLGMPAALPVVSGCGNTFEDNEASSAGATDTDNNDTFGTSLNDLIDPCPATTAAPTLGGVGQWLLTILLALTGLFSLRRQMSQSRSDGEGVD